MLYAIPAYAIGAYSNVRPPPPTTGKNDFSILIVGELHIGKRGMIPEAFERWNPYRSSDWRDEYQYFAVNLSLDALKQVDDARTWRKILGWSREGWDEDEEPQNTRMAKVGFYDRSLKEFEGDPKRRYKSHTFDAVAICYDPCSPRES